MFWKHKTSELFERAVLVTCDDIENGKITSRKFVKSDGKWTAMHESEIVVIAPEFVPLIIDFVNSNRGIDKNPKYYAENGNRLKVDFWGNIYESS